MNLIVLTKKWGRNFTGATLATQYFVSKWTSHFDTIYVFTLNKGDSSLSENVEVTLCHGERELCKKIKNLVNRIGKNEVVGYSDDHLGYLLNKCGVRYLHTYHGNWPDARKTDLVYFAKSFYFIPLYKRTLKNASKVVNVSQYMSKFTDKSNSDSVVIRNGIDVKIAVSEGSTEKRFLMVGNVDNRKYGKLVAVLDYLKKQGAVPQIYIYGRIDDERLGKRLSEYEGVTLRGLCKEIPFKDYVGLINTSCVENLSISVCEALINEIPVICFDVGGLAEVVHDGKNGFVIDKFDTQMMSQKIVDIFNGYKFLECKFENIHEYNWDYAAKRYIELFDNMG